MRENFLLKSERILNVCECMPSIFWTCKMKNVSIFSIILVLVSPLVFWGQASTVTVNVYGGNPPSISQVNSTSYQINSVIQEYGTACLQTPSLHVAIIDSQNCTPWGSRWTDQNLNITYNPTHFYNNENNEGTCRNRVERHFIFQQNNASQLSGLERMLEDSVPSGYYVLIYTMMYVSFDDWFIYNPNLFSTLQVLGANSLGNQDSVPMIFFTQKGIPSSTIEMYGQNINDSLSLSLNVGCLPVGMPDNSFDSPDLMVVPNPAQNFIQIKWRGGSFTGPNVRLSLYDQLGNVRVRNIKMNNGLNSIDISLYPNGIYYLILTTDGGTSHATKVIVAR